MFFKATFFYFGFCRIVVFSHSLSMTLCLFGIFFLYNKVIHKSKGRKNMKKYLSCIILIILCVVCAAIFYVNANSLDPSAPPPTSVPSSVPAPNQNNGVAEKKVTIDKSGTITSEYLTDTNLRIEWSIYKLENEPVLYVSAELYLDTPEQITNAGAGYISVNGDKREFTTKTMVGTSNLLTSYSASIDAYGNDEIYFEAFLDVTSVSTAGEKINGVRACGKAFARESYLNMPNSKNLQLDVISKFPELPSGDEITSLCMVLNYLKYNVNKCDLNDLYLVKGPAHYTDIFEANAGNPKDTYNSYGCMPPVIVNAANKYISINGGRYYAQDISGISELELYYEVSQGNPVIVWACEDFDSTPSIFRTLIIDGKTIYLKSNVNTMVLIGYNFTSKTVTLADLSGVVFDVDMDLFETRFSQVGSYAVLIK